MKNEFGVGILGLGTYVPEKILTNADLEKIVDTSDEWIVERTGIRERRVVADDMATSDLATNAARKALEEANTTPEEIDLIICCTATPDMFFPSVACIVQANIGAVNAACFDLAAGCTGFMYGLATATQFIRSGFYKKVLVLGAETLTRVTNWSDRNTCVLFGDGAGAIVLGRCESGRGILGLNLGADGTGGEFLKLPAGGSRMPASAETVANNLHTIYMNGPEVFKFAVKVMGESALKAIDASGLTPADIDLFIPHQANIRIIQSAAKRLKMPMDKVFVNLDKYGNTSSASIPIALREAVDAGRVKDGDLLVAVGFGAGLTWASCVIKWGKGDKTIA